MDLEQRVTDLEANLRELESELAAAQDDIAELKGIVIAIRDDPDLAVLRESMESDE